MTDLNYTALVLVVDRSGSMQSIREDIEGGLNALLEEQKNLPGVVTVDLVLFDDHYQEVYGFRGLDEATVEINPRGMTALHDAVGKKIVSFGEDLAKMDDAARPGKVMFVVATDGFENASQEYTAEAVKNLVTEQQDVYGWDFVFLGANQDAVLTGGSMGFKADKSMTFSASTAGVDATSTALRSYMTSYRTTGEAGFTEADREAATKS